MAAAVLSGNRNFEGRISPHVKANYLASPPLVVAYALAGTMDIDLRHDPLGTGSDGQPVFLRDIWPSAEEVREAVQQPSSRRCSAGIRRVVHGQRDMERYPGRRQAIFTTGLRTPAISASPPFFADLAPSRPIRALQGARVLLMLGDSVTTDHISPAGAIPADGPAGSTCRSRVWRRRTSTPSAHAVATTKS